MSRRNSISDELPEPVEVVGHPRRAGPGEKSRKRSSWPRIEATLRRERLARRAGCARWSGPTGRRSSRSRRRRARPAGRRGAGAGAGRRSGPGGRCGATVRGRVEAVVAGDRPARRESRPEARRRRVEHPAPARARRGARPAPETSPGARIGHGRVTARAGEPVELSRARSGRAGSHGPYGIVRPDMQTSLARRQRHRRSLDRGPPRGSSAVRRVGHRHPAPPVLVLPRARAARVLGVGGRVQLLQPGTCRIPATLDNLHVRPADVVYDRTGKVELASSASPARGRDLRPDPARDARRDDRDRGQGLLDEPGLRPRGLRLGRPRHPQRQPRGGSTITQQLVRARLLPPERLRGLGLRAQDPGDHPVAPPDRGLSRARRASRRSSTAYLNQNFYGNQSYGVAAAAQQLLRQGPEGPDPGPGRILAAIPQSPTKFDLVKNAMRSADRTRTPRARRPRSGSSSRRTPRSSPRRNYVLDLMKTRSVLSGTKHTVAEYEAAKGEPVDPRARRRRQLAGAALRVAGPQPARRDPVRHVGRQCKDIDTGGYRVTTTLNWKMQPTVEKWLYAARSRPNMPGTRRKLLKRLKIPRTDWSWIQNLRGTNIHNGAGRGHGLPDGRGPRVRRLAPATPRTATRSSSPSSTSCATAGASRDRRSSRSTTSSASRTSTMTAATMFMDVVTDFGPQARPYPTQADGLERGPVRLRSAPSSSRSTSRRSRPAIMNGLDHLFNRDEGLRHPLVPNGQPGAVDEHRHDRDPPDRHDQRVRRDRITCVCSRAIGDRVDMRR